MENQQLLQAIERLLDTKLDEKMDAKLAAMETRLDERMDAKLAAMESRIADNLSTQLAEVIGQQNETIASMFSEMREEMARGFNVLLETKAGKEIAQVADGVVMNAERITALEARVDTLEAGTRAS